MNNTSKYYYREASALTFLMYLYGSGSHQYQYGNVRSLLSDTDCTFINNAVEHEGGAVTIDITSYSHYNHNSNSLRFFITDTLFINNTSQVRGGAVYNSNAHHIPVSVHMQRNVFFSNTAYFASGGAIHFNGQHSTFYLVGNSLCTNMWCSQHSILPQHH